MNIFELLLFHAPISDNVCTITKKMILSIVENKIKLAITLITLAYTNGQMVWFLYRFYAYPDIDYACHYAPMVFTCLFSSVGTTQVFLKHSHFKKSVTFIRKNFWPQEYAMEEAKQDISHTIGIIKMLTVTTICLAMVTSLIYMPFNGIDYYESLFPAIEFVGQLNMPEELKFWIAVIISPLMFPLLYFVAILGVVLSFYVCNFISQAIMIKWIIINITKDLETTNNNVDILDDIECQNIIEKRLIKCVKHHITLCSYAKYVHGYFYYTMIWHIIFVVTLIGSLLYMIFFQTGARSNQLAVVTECLVVSFGTFMYCFIGESYERQMDEIFDATRHSKWYYFNVQNRKIFSILLLNLRRSYKIECAGIFCMNLKLNIWIFQKAYAVVSVLGAMKE